MSSPSTTTQPLNTSEEATARTAMTGPYRTHYHDAGEGPAVIMLHGGGPGASGWSNFRGNVPAFAARHRTLLVDMLGFGGSASVVFDSEPSTTVRARAIVDLMDELGIESSSFVGNSMGGSVAMAIAVDYPERVDRLVLLGPHGLTKTVNAPQPTEGHKILRAARANPTLDSLQALVNVMLFDPSAMSPDALEKRLVAAQNPEHRAAELASSAPWRDQTPEFSRVGAKTLLVWGREDRVNPLEIGLMQLRDIPDSRLYVIRNCGHWAQLEHQDEFNRVALDFLNAP